MSIQNEIDSDFKLLYEYMNIYIQLLQYSVSCGGLRLDNQLPTFEYFKQTYDESRYSLVVPHYKESVTVSDNKIVKAHTVGLGSINGIAYRYFNYWMGCKYFTGGNTEGDYIVIEEEINRVVKNM